MNHALRRGYVIRMRHSTRIDASESGRSAAEGERDARCRIQTICKARSRHYRVLMVCKTSQIDRFCNPTHPHSCACATPVYRLSLSCQPVPPVVARRVFCRNLIAVHNGVCDPVCHHLAQYKLHAEALSLSHPTGQKTDANACKTLNASECRMADRPVERAHKMSHGSVFPLPSLPPLIPPKRSKRQAIHEVAA